MTSQGERQSQRFRVAVVTVWEVEAVDRSDAFRKAEGAVEYAVRSVDQSPPGHGHEPRLRWSRYGNRHEATLVVPPLEVDTAVAAGHLRVRVGKV